MVWWQSLLGTLAAMVWLLVLIACIAWICIARRRWTAVLALAALLWSGVAVANAFSGDRETRRDACVSSGGLVVATSEHGRACIDARPVRMDGKTEWTE